MQAPVFNEIVSGQLEKSTEVLITKAKEYATDGDRLHNFKVAAELQGISMREALAGMMAKHTTSVYDMCRSPYHHTQEQWDEKITDHINYLLLLQAVLQEEREMMSETAFVSGKRNKDVDTRRSDN